MSLCEVRIPTYKRTDSHLAPFMGNRRIILELDREPQDLQAVWRLDLIARLIQQALFTLSTHFKQKLI